MNAGQFRVCTDCPDDVWRSFTVRGSDHLAPQLIFADEVGPYLIDGWTVTYHDHKERTS